MFTGISLLILALVTGYVLAMGYVSGWFADDPIDEMNDEQEVPTHFVSVNGRIY